MEKTIMPSSWDFGQSITQVIKYSSKGLVGADYGVLVKRAGEEAAHWLKNIDMADDQLPIHVIAMGAKEAYGPNRNGDAFSEAALMKFHPTFVKSGNWFRHHKNKDPKIRYGNIKASFYNKAMRRVELLGLLNLTKEAADKYGGFVADKEAEMIESGKDIPVSMACHIDYDVCSGCHNKARTRAEYCTGDTCKYGGCRDNLTKVAADGHILHVDNPHPHFFDISTVIRPADRIAYGNEAGYLRKAASYGDTIGGAAMAEAYNIVPPLSVWEGDHTDALTVSKIKMAYKLAAIEDTIESNRTRYCDVARAFSLNTPDVELNNLGTVGTEKFAAGLRALADQDIVLPVRTFLRAVLGDGTKYAEFSEIVPGLLPGVYNRLLRQNTLFSEYRNQYNPSQKLASVTQRDWATKLAEHHSLSANLIRRRIALSSIRNIEEPTLLAQNVKLAAVSRQAEKLARDYAMYKLSYLVHKNVNVPFTQELVVLQNYVS